MLGRTVSHYRISSQLGAGGMGVVYAAEDVRLGRPVALKLVQEEFAKDPTIVERLRAEARAASALNHPNICTIYDIGEHDGQPFIVMELLKGQTLRDKLAGGPLRIPDLIDVAIQVADALDAAHRHGILHRDIKPANLFLLDRGMVKILDFGVAKRLMPPASSGTTAFGTQELVTTQGLVVGTVAYMSPEQVSGEQLDGRTDVFSLGVVLYECATGRQPFTGKTPGVTLAAILNQSPVAPVVLNSEVPTRLQEVINNCLEKDPELRYADAAGLRADLKRIRRDLESGQSHALGATAATSRVDGVVSRSKGEQRRTRRLTLGALTVSVLAAALIPTWIWSRKPPVINQAPPSASAAVPALTRAPDDVDADRIRQEALARFDEATERARRLITLGDLDGASAAVAVASTIDAQSAAVVELSQRISQLRAQRGRPNPGAPPPAQAAAPTAVAQTPTARESTGVATLPVPAPPAPSLPAAQEPVAVTPQPAAPVVEVQPQPAQPARPPEQPLRTNEESPVSRGRAAAAQGPTAEDDDAIIRRVIDMWAQAIERKDLAAYRTVKPSLSPDEVRRIQEGFRAVSSQRVAITILGIDHPTQNSAVVRVRRRDMIVAGGRQQTADIQQTMTLGRSGTGWVITEIGR